MTNSNNGFFSLHEQVGGHPLQWIEIDLQAPATVRGIELYASQYPDGETVHRVLGKGHRPMDEYQLLHEFRGFTLDNDVLVYNPDLPWSNIQYLTRTSRKFHMTKSKF